MESIKKTEPTREQCTERSLASEVLQELKLGCKRLWIALLIVVILWAVTIVGFVWYQSQWDYSTTSTYEANGIYALIDSSGNIIAQDVTQEQMDAFTKWWEVNGDSQKNDNTNKN